MSRLSQEELDRFRAMDAAKVILACATHAKRDTTFVPATAKDTERWHVNVDGKEFELLLHGPKFYDTRAAKGGGGAIDLLMHLYRVSFLDAVSRLKRMPI